MYVLDEYVCVAVWVVTCIGAAMQPSRNTGPHTPIISPTPLRINACWSSPCLRPQVAFKRLLDNVPLSVRGVLRKLEYREEVEGAILQAVIMGAAGAGAGAGAAAGAGEAAAGVGAASGELGWMEGQGGMGAGQVEDGGWGGGRGAGMIQQVWGQEREQQQGWRLDGGIGWQRGGGVWGPRRPRAGRQSAEQDVMVEGGWRRAGGDCSTGTALHDHMRHLV